MFIWLYRGGVLHFKKPITTRFSAHQFYSQDRLKSNILYKNSLKKSPVKTGYNLPLKYVIK